MSEYTYLVEAVDELEIHLTIEHRNQQRRRPT